jgi:hypothetical protein
MTRSFRRGQLKTLMLVVAAVSLTCSWNWPVSVMGQTNSRITKQGALSAATNELRRRKFVLPMDYETEVAESSFRPEIGPVRPQVSVTFLAGKRSHRIRIYFVTIDRATGEVDFVDNLINPVDSTPPPYIRAPSGITKQQAVVSATREIRRRGLALPARYRTRVAKSVFTPKSGPDTHALFVSFFDGKETTSRQLYQVAVNQDAGSIEFVFDFVAGTMK